MTEHAVYAFGFLDRKTGDLVIDSRMATPQTIRRLKAIAQLESMRLVGAHEINADGFVCATATCGTAQESSSGASLEASNGT
jgi:hypothetical protein